jgi:hypothetical protein
MTMHRWQVINHYLKTKFENSDPKYLEIGIHNGDNFLKVECADKTGIDPSPIYKSNRIFQMTSDDFFDSNEQVFDVIFIDGLHEREQVEKDFWNAFQCLSLDGIIILHDCSPRVYFETVVPRPKPIGRWNGDTYKAWIKIREIFPQATFTIATDEGLGVFLNSLNQINDQGQWSGHHVTWDEYKKKRALLLNEISLDAFKSLI